MKKTMIITLVIVMCIALLAGCGKKEKEEQTGVVNPVKTFESFNEQQAALGIGLEAPAGAENVRYQGINKMAETQFTLDGVDYFYRAEATDGTKCYDISGLYYTFDNTQNGTVKEREAVASTCKDAGFVMWLDIVTGVNYNLGTASKTDADKLFEVAELAFVPMQGNAG